jgi:hypothetical protein
MSQSKPIVNAKEAVRDIRRGVTDEALMENYAITARGLESLFRKLVTSGEIGQTELDQRPSLRGKSQSVVLGGGLGERPKVLVSAPEAIRAVKAGASDLQLMEEFCLSARGVDKLLRKLVIAGELDQAELDRRMYASQFFSVVQVDEPTEQPPPKPKIKASEAVAQVRGGVSDAELMEKYAISAKGLDSLFRKLVIAGEIMQAELDHRSMEGSTSLSLDTDALFQDETLATAAFEHVQPIKPETDKRKISAAQVAADIRGGMTDMALMAKYALSARGLEGLCRKLVEAGKVEQAELDRRMIRSQLSHFVDLEGLPDLSLQGQRISSEDALSSVRSGVSDAGLMKKYQLSAMGLDALFRTLVATGRLSREEVDARKNGKDLAELAFEDELGPSRTPVDADEPEFQFRPCSSWDRLGEWYEEYRSYVKAAGGASVVLLALAIWGGHVTVFDDILGKKLWNRIGISPSTNRNIRGEAGGALPIFEEMNKNPPVSGTFNDPADSEALQRCLESCKKEHASPDGADEGFLVGCRMECVSKHGRAVKNIQKNYYGRE